MEKVFTTLYLLQLTVADKVSARLEKAREKGQGSLEYIGMIAIAALIVAAVAWGVQKVGIREWVVDAINEMKDAPKTKPE